MLLCFFFNDAYPKKLNEMKRLENILVYSNPVIPQHQSNGSFDCSCGCNGNNNCCMYQRKSIFFPNGITVHSPVAHIQPYEKTI